MNQLSWIGLQSFAFSLVLTPIFRDIFRSFKVVDEPDNNRKVHVQPIPRVGGIAIVIAYFLTLYVTPPGTGWNSLGHSRLLAICCQPLCSFS